MPQRSTTFHYVRFRGLIAEAEPHLLLRGDGATKELVDAISHFPQAEFTVQQEDNIRRLLSSLPRSAQTKYRKALAYLIDTLEADIYSRSS